MSYWQVKVLPGGGCRTFFTGGSDVPISIAAGKIYAEFLEQTRAEILKLNPPIVQIDDEVISLEGEN